ncbi:YbaB/EbfC family nucleoid-associated protein [Rhodococcoides fascians]|uniref:YbaB/EbfC family nucleoid-associated protein n=1 Tax=Rhodococcoides fascians TaxID=1828 RepID=UPI00056282E1|nr:YbaB/EbfC family nucleoid-associated protein [Rhodococcus fascians]
MATEDAAAIAAIEANSFRLGDELAQVNGEYTSVSGISVTVDAGGRITHFQLSDSLSAVAPSRLAPMILEATKRARQDAGQRTAAILSEFKSDPTFAKAVAMIENVTLGNGYGGDARADTIHQSEHPWMERP